jgi:dihydropyrimidinase/allantoinase
MGVVMGGLAIDQGRISAIGDNDSLPPAEDVIDGRRSVVLPGLVDAHVHLRDPGLTQREDFETGTRAAAAGGITTVLDMPNTLPTTTSAKRVQEKAAHCETRAVVDFGLYGGVGASNLNEIDLMARAGVVGFKTFLHPAPTGRAEEYEHLTTTDDRDLLEVMDRVAAIRLPLVVHAENSGMIEWATSRGRSDRLKGLKAHSRARPPEAELDAVWRLCLFAKATGVHLHLPHLSSADAVEVAAQFRHERTEIQVETCPHYLFCDEEMVESLGPFAKVNPPLRGRSQRERLWACLRRGLVDRVASDHAPYTVEEKRLGWDEIHAAPSGSPGLETLLPVLLEAVANGSISFPELVRLCAENPAKHFSLWPRKGAIVVGADADLVLIDPSAEGRIDRTRQQTKARQTAWLFDGWRHRGVIRWTMVRGRMVWQDDEIIVEPGWGRWIIGASAGRGGGLRARPGAR